MQGPKRRGGDFTKSPIVQYPGFPCRDSNPDGTRAQTRQSNQVVGDMLRTRNIRGKDDLDPDFQWKGVLSAVRQAVRSIVHTTTRATPTQLVFGRDAIWNIHHNANWRYITTRKQNLINQNNLRENSTRIPYRYRVGQQVLIKVEQSTKYGSDAYLGPYTIE